jgi:hypothetical protein
MKKEDEERLLSIEYPSLKIRDNEKYTFLNKVRERYSEEIMASIRKQRIQSLRDVEELGERIGEQKGAPRLYRRYFREVFQGRDT